MTPPSSDESCTGSRGARVSGRRLPLLELGTLVFVAVAMAVGSTLPTARPTSPFGAALHSLFLSTYRPFVGRWTVVSIVGLVLCVVAAVRVVAQGAAMVWPSFLIALASRVVVNVSRRGPHELAYPFTGPERHNEYIAAVPMYVDHPLRFLEVYARLGRALPEHPAGHPPGPTMLFGLLAQIGLPGAWPEVVVILVLGAATAPLLWLLARELVDDRSARVATVLWIFAPSVLIESATSADAIYAFVGTATALLLVRQRHGLGAVAATLGTFLSYALVAIPMWAIGVVAWQRGWRRAITQVVATVATATVFYVLLWWATGYDPIAAYRATAHRYFLGAGRRRPYWFWVFGDAAAFGLGLGIPTLIGFARGVRRGAVPAVALVMIIVAASLSGYTKAEVERIWLFLTPLAAISAAPMIARWRPGVALCLLAGQALTVEVLYRTPW